MRVFCEQEELARGLTMARRVLGSPKIWAIYGAMLLTASEDKLTIRSGIDMGMEFPIEAEVEEAGAVCVHGRILSDLVRLLPDERVELSCGKVNVLTVRCGRTKSNINGFEPLDFPPRPHFSDDGQFELNGKLLREMIQQVAASAATDRGRPILAGALVDCGQSESHRWMEMVATDGLRLSAKVAGERTDSEEADRIAAVLPTQALNELARLISPDDAQPVRVEILEGDQIRRLLFGIGDVEFWAPLIEGEYPDFHKVLAVGSQVTVVLPVKELTQALQSVARVAESAGHVVRLSFKPGDASSVAVTVNAISSEIGDQSAELHGTHDGLDGLLEIGMNNIYLLSALGRLGRGQGFVELGMDGELKPVLVGVPGDDSLTHVIMPMRLS